jgi:hypothetical protein
MTTFTKLFPWFIVTQSSRLLCHCGSPEAPGN